MLTALKNRNHTWRVAHRGCHPENKIIGFRQAIEDGCDMVECNVRLSGDNQPVLIHDTTINRTTNGTGRVSKLTCHELQFYGVPSLEEFLSWFKQQLGLYCAIEIKGGQNVMVLLQKTLTLVHKFNLLDYVVIISIDKQVISASKLLFPNVFTGLILKNTVFRHPLDIANKANADTLWVHYTLLSKVIQQQNNITCNIPIFLWTINSKKELQGIDKTIAGVVSDDLQSLFKEQQFKHKSYSLQNL